MKEFDISEFDRSTTPRSNDQLFAEASQLGLRPGEWPRTIKITNVEGTDYIFQRESRIDDDGAVTYLPTAHGGPINEVTIAND